MRSYLARDSNQEYTCISRRFLFVITYAIFGFILIKVKKFICQSPKSLNNEGLVKLIQSRGHPTIYMFVTLVDMNAGTFVLFNLN